MSVRLPHGDLYEAVRALEENLGLLSRPEHKVARNLNNALLNMAAVQMKMQQDIEYLNDKIGPLLREIAEEYGLAREVARGPVKRGKQGPRP